MEQEKTMHAVDVKRTDELIEQNYGLVYRTAVSVAGNAADAEDICHDALLAISKAYARFRGESSLSTWIYRITLRVAMRWLARNRSRGSEPIPEPVAGASGLPLEIIQAFSRIPLNSRTVLMLVAVEGFSHAEAADALGIPVGTIASRLHNARKQLSQQLER